MSQRNIYNLALNRFIEKKCDRLKEYLGSKFQKELYYNSKDREYILNKLDSDEAKVIWEKLVKNIYEYKLLGGFARATFPFCIKFKNNCDECVYGRNHNNCKDMECIWDLLEAVSILDVEIFPNEWYRKVIEEINREVIGSD